MDGQPEPAADDQGHGPMSENEVCVDLDALAMPSGDGEGKEMNAPAVGDKVQMAIEGEVSRIVGSKAYVTMEAVNGQPVEQSEQEPNDDQELASLQQMAQGMPDKY